jgi:glycosyltransferase involved in cell wall biosynthesis
VSNCKSANTNCRWYCRINYAAQRTARFNPRFRTSRKRNARFDFTNRRCADVQQDHLYLQELEKSVEQFGLEKSVRFLGLRKDVAAIMQSLDVLVVNSKSEALVIVAIEAMACGTPVIATTVGGIKEMIEHQVNGWLVPYGDEKLLRKALIALSRDSNLRAKFARTGREVVASRLHADRFIKELEDFFAEFGHRSQQKSEMQLVEH